MKITCPICNREGYLEMRGSSMRIKHYEGYTNGRRVYTIHTIAGEQLGINRGNKLGIKNGVLAVEGGMEPRAGFGPATITLPR